MGSFALSSRPHSENKQFDSRGGSHYFDFWAAANFASLQGVHGENEQDKPTRNKSAAFLGGFHFNWCAHAGLDFYFSR